MAGERRWVFRFPKTAKAAEATIKEIGLMPAPAPTLPVVAPDFALSAPNGVLNYLWPFAGYGFIPGVQLARHVEAGRRGLRAVLEQLPRQATQKE